MKKNWKLGIIGGGFMSRAILEGAVRRGVLKAEEIAVSEPDAVKADSLRALGVQVTDNSDFAARCDYLLFAVKPQVFPEVARQLKGISLPVLITIMAGRSKRSIRCLLENEHVRIARVMPNLPCAVGEGMSAVDAVELSEDAREFVLRLFGAIGKVVQAEEEQMDAVTGVSGSGPAYIYLFLQALIAAGVEQGLTAEQSRLLALQTMKGGVAMAERHPDQSLQSLIDAVSSKGGTTVAALGQFEKDGFALTVSRAVAAAVRRAKELSE